MSSDVKIPEWAMEEARKIDLPTLSPLDREYARRDFARALLAAEQRGLKRAAKVVAAMLPNLPPDGPDGPVQEAEYVALGNALAAIRSLGEQE